MFSNSDIKLSTSTCYMMFKLLCYIHVQLYAIIVEVLFDFSTMFNRLQISLIFSIFLFAIYVSSGLSIIINTDQTSVLVRSCLEALERQDESTQHIWIYFIFILV